MDALNELDALATGLLRQAQKLPPTAERFDVLKEIGKMRQRLDALKRKQKEGSPSRNL